MAATCLIKKIEDWRLNVYCTKVEIRRSRLECLPRLHQRPDPHNWCHDDDVDQQNSKIVDIIRSAAEQSIPRTKPSVCRRQKPLPYWNDEIKMAVRNRNRARRKMNRTRNINDCIEYRRLKSINRPTSHPISSSWILAELLRPADQPKSTYCSLEHGKEDERNQV